MRNRLQLSHPRHTGRHLPHEYTSYGPLMLILVLLGLTLTYATVYATDPPPQAGSVGLTGTMPGVAPKVAASISTPTNGQHFGTSPITVSGTCAANTLVEVYKNDIFGGSGPCSSSGNYSFQVDLLIGQNVLIARVYDALNQPGPDSNSVTVFYDALPAQAAPLGGLNFGSGQLLINTDAVYRGIFPGQSLSVPISILGGTPPYAINIEWGDSKNNVVPRGDNQTFNAEHTYTKAGTYQITMQASDAGGRVAFLTVAAIVNGQPSVLANSGSNSKPVSKIIVLWPLYTSAVAVVASFWFGERRERHILVTAPINVHN